MTTQDDIAEVVAILRKNVSIAIGEKDSEKLMIEIQELNRIGTLYTINATFRTLLPLFGGRTGKIFAILNKTDGKLEIRSLKIDEKGL